MKIGIIAFTDIDRISSTGRRICMLGRGLAILGHEVHIIVPPKFQPGPLEYQKDGLYYHQALLTTPAAWENVGTRLKARIATLKIVNKLAAQGLNWLLLYNLGLEGVAYLIAARRRGIFVAAEYCDLRIVSEHKSIIRKLQHIWRQGADLIIPKQVQLIITISEFLKKQLNIRAMHTPTLIVPAIVDTELFIQSDKGAREFRAKWHLGTTPIIGYLGSYWTLEGVKILLQAAKKLLSIEEEFKVLLCGEAVKGLDCDDVDRLVRELGLHNQVVQTGWLPTDQVIAALSSATVLVVPKLDNDANRAGFPTKISEYLSIGKPIIASRIGDVPNYLIDGQDVLFFPPGDIDILARLLKGLLDDEGLRERLGDNARKAAIAFFDYRSAGRMIEEKMRDIALS